MNGKRKLSIMLKMLILKLEGVPERENKQISIFHLLQKLKVLKQKMTMKGGNTDKHNSFDARKNGFAFNMLKALLEVERFQACIGTTSHVS